MPFAKQSWKRCAARVLLGVVSALIMHHCPARGADVQPSSAVRILERAQAGLDREDYEDAFAEAGRGLEQSPLYLPLWRVRARAGLALGNHTAAMEAIRTVLAGDPGDTDLIDAGLAAIVFAAGRRERAVRRSLADYIGMIGAERFAPAFARLVAERPDIVLRLPLVTSAWRDAAGPDAAAARLLDMYTAGAFADAAAELSTPKGGDIDGRTGGAIGFLVGRALVVEGRYEEGIACLERARTADFPAYAADRWLGVAYKGLGLPKRAADTWLSGWRLDRDPARAAIDIADALLAADEAEELDAFLESALAAFPEHPGLQARKLLALDTADRGREATRYAARVSKYGSLAGMAYGQALIARRRGEYDAARVELAEAGRELADSYGKELPPDQVEAWLNAGLSTRVADEAARRRDLVAKGRVLWNDGRRVDALILWDDSLRAGEVAAPRRFILAAVDDLFAAGGTAMAMATLSRYVPEMTPFDLLASYAARNRWEDVSVLSRNVPGEGEGAASWIPLFRAIAATRSGQPADVAEAMRILAAAPLDNRPLSFVRIGDDDAPVRFAMSLADRQRLVDGLGDTLIEDGYTDSYPAMLKSPYWSRGRGLVAAVRTLIRTGQTEAAKTFLLTAIETAPGDPVANFHLAYIHYREGDADQAYACVNSGMRRAHGAVREGLLSLQARLNRQPEAALEHLLNYVVLEPGDNDLRLMAIRDLVNKRRYREAVEHRDHYLRLRGGAFRDAMSHLALAHIELGDFASAEALWRDLLEQSPQSPRRLAGLGATLNLMERPEATVEELGPLARETGDRELTALLAEACMALADYDVALEWIGLGLETSPDDMRLLGLGVNVAEALGDAGVIEAFAQRYLEADSRAASVQSVYASALMRQEKWADLHRHSLALLARNRHNKGAMEREYEYAASTGNAELIWYASKRVADTYGNEPLNILQSAVGAAGVGEFRYALGTLETITDLGPNSAVLTLYVPRVSVGRVVGAVPVDELIDRLETLRVGFKFVGLEAYGYGANPEKEYLLEIPVLLLVGRSTPAALDELDDYLEARCARACLVIGEESLHDGTPVWADIDYLRRLQASGRWEFALSDFEPRRFPDREPGRETLFWTQARWLGKRYESGNEMHSRMLAELGRITAKAREAGVEPGGWLHPEWGDYGQRVIDSRPDEVMAYRRAVADRFCLAFTQAAAGYRIPGGDCLRIPARAVSASLCADELLSSLLDQHPTRRSVLELAKVKSWHGQTPAAGELYEYAGTLGLNPGEISYFHGRNSYYEGDVPTAIALAEEAVALEPESERAWDLYHDAHRLLRPQVSLAPRVWHDSDDQNYQEVAANVAWHVSHNLQLRVNGGLYRWADDDGAAVGASLGLGARYYFMKGNYLQGDLKAVSVNHGAGTHLEGGLLWHGIYNLAPFNYKVNGFFDLEYRHEGIETRKAQLAGIRANRFALNTSTRVNNWWDVDLNVSYTARTDDNDGWAVLFRPTYRLKEIPQIRVGYWFAAADSDRNPEEYYAPVNYQAHQLVAMYRGDINECLSAYGLASIGVARTGDTDWRAVFRANVGLRYILNECSELSGYYQYLKLPDYSLHNYSLTYSYRF